MKAIVVYESMYGNTHAIADAIAEGLGGHASVRVLSVHDVEAEDVASADLVVVGGPTHVHGMTRASTRKAALAAAAEPGAALHIDTDAEGPGLREWFDDLAVSIDRAAAFDTRMHGPAMVTGRASKGIAARLRAHGATLVAAPVSFIVTKENELLPDEAAHAEAWGESVARAMSGLATGSSTTPAL